MPPTAPACDNTEAYEGLAALLRFKQCDLGRLPEILRMRSIDVAPKMHVVQEYVHAAPVVIESTLPLSLELICASNSVLLKLKTQDCEGATHQLGRLGLIRLVSIRNPPATASLIHWLFPFELLPTSLLQCSRVSA